jgi:hypothetical protein
VLVAPGETSIADEHYGSTRLDTPRRAPRAKIAVEHQFLAGVSKLPTELAQLLTLHAAHGHDALIAALARAVAFRRWRADDVRSILAAAGAAPKPRPAGQALVLTLPSVPTRSLSDYALDTTGGDLS